MAILRAAATAADTLDATSDTLVVGLTLTPASGDYQLFATVETENASAGGSESNIFSVYVGGTIVSHTERNVQEETSLDLDRITVALNAKVSPSGSQAVEIRHRTSSSASPQTAFRRELTLFPTPAAGTHYEDSDTVDDTLATATWTTLASMTRTPVADDYLLIFSCDAEGPSDVNLGFRVEVGGTAVAHSVRRMENENSLPNTPRPLMVACKVSPSGSQIVEIAWSRVSGTGTITCHKRTMNLVPVDAGDIVEATGTVDDTRTVTTDILIDDMTITDPGDNDWMMCFSSWDDVGTIGNLIETTYSMRSGGTTVTDSQRRNDHEGSSDLTELPVLAGGRVTVASATDDLEMYWQVSTTDLWTLHERTFVGIREVAIGDIAATAALAFTAAADLKGDGKLDATAALVFAGATVDLKADGKLNATAALIFSAASATLAAVGTLAATAALAFSAAANLDGQGALGASPAMAFSATASLTNATPGGAPATAADAYPLRRVEWTEKPPEGTPLDLSHPMAEGLIYFCAMDRAGNQIDLVHNREGTFTQTGTAVLTTQVQTPHGLVVDHEFGGTNDEIGFVFGNTGGSGYYEPTKLTIVARVRPGNEDDTGGSRIVSKRTAAGGDDNWAIYTLTDIVANDELHFKINGLDDIITRTSGNWQDKLIDVALSVDAAGQNNYVWEVETGLSQSLLGQTGATVDQSAGNLATGHRDGQDRSFDGDMHYVAIWDRPQTQTFIEDFRRNPWQIFEPRREILQIFRPAVTQTDVYPLRRVEWTEKPPEGTPLDLTHPMAQGLFYFCAVDRPGDQIDLVHNRAGAFTEVGTSSIDPLIQTPEGIVCRWETEDTNDAGFNFGNTGGSGYYEPTQLTIITRADVADEGASGGSRIISKRDGVAASDNYSIYVATVGDFIRFRIDGSDDTVAPVSGDWFNTRIIAALSVDTVGQDNYVWDVDTGNLQTKLGQAGASVDTTSGNLCLGFRDSGGRTFDGDIHWVAMWDRPQTATFIEDFWHNPWQIFEPRREPLLIESPATQTDVYPLRTVPRFPLVVSRRFDHTGDGTTSRGLQYDNMAGLDAGPVTVATWLYLTESPAVDQHIIYTDQLASDTDDGGVRLIFTNTDDLEVSIVTSGANVRTTASNIAQPGDLGVWFHVACRWDGTVGNIADLYVNGVLTNDGTDAGTGGRSTAPGSHSVGGRESTIARGLGGGVYGLGRWERLLSAQEIRALAEGLHPLDLHPNDLVICPDFDTGENLAPAYIGPSTTPNRFDWVKDTFDPAPVRLPVKRRPLLIESPLGVPPAAPEALNATAALIFAATADLKAQGKLDGTAAMVFGGTADLNAVGKLDATAAMVFAATADLKAQGKLDATAALIFSATADLKGDGKLDATAALIFSATANLDALGKLDATAVLAFSALSAGLSDGGLQTATYPLRRVEWTEKPPEGTPLDMTHPMAQGLFFFCAMDRPGDQLDLVHSRAGTLVDSGASVLTPLVQTPEGVVVRFEIGGIDDIGFLFGNTGASGYYEPTALTIITRVRPGDEDQTGGSRIISKPDGLGGDDWALYTGTTTVANDSIVFRINDLADVVVRSSGDWQGALLDLALSVDAAGQDNYIWEVENGLSQFSLGQTGATVDQSSTNLAIGYRDAGDRNFDGDIHYVAAWDRPQTKQFIEDFRRNPWQIFQPRHEQLLITQQVVEQTDVYPIRRVPWTEQPPFGTPLDLNNPLTEGLVLCAIPHSGGVFDPIQNVHLTPSGSAFTTARGGGISVDCALNNSDAYEYPKNDALFAGLTEATWAALAQHRPPEIVGATGPEMVWSHDGTGADPFTVQMQQSEDFRAIIDTSVGEFIDAIVDGLDQTAGTPADQLNVLGAIWRSDVITARINHISGSGTATTGTMAVGSDSANLARVSGNTSTSSWDGWVSLAVFWNRALSDAEFDSFVDNPWQIFEPRRLPLLINSAIGPLGPITASAALVFSAAADLKADGKLDATAALVFSAAADLTAVGKIDATAALIFSATADLKAQGKLDATAALIFSATANLDALGKLDATAAMIFGGTADLKADGKLDATAALIFSATADLVDATPVGPISATALLVFGAAADLKGDGKLDATAAMAFTQAADLKADGKLDATAALVFGGVADISSRNRIDATAALVFSSTANLDAVGKLDATAPMIFSAAADLKGQGKLDATAAMVFSQAADLKAQGKLDATALLVFSAAADLKADGKLDATAALVFSATANLVDATPGGDISATALLAFSGAPDLKGGGKLDATAALVFSATAALQQPLGATAGLIFSATADLEGPGTLDATAALIFSATADLLADGKLDATAPLVFSAAADLKADGKLDATALLTFSETADLRADGKLDATALLAFSATADLKELAGPISATAALIFSATAALLDGSPTDLIDIEIRAEIRLIEITAATPKIDITGMV